MKKFILCILVMMFTVLSANAVDIVRYNNAGAPISISRGMSRPISVTQFPRYERLRMGRGMAHPAGFAQPIYPPRRYYDPMCPRRRQPRVAYPNIMPPPPPAPVISRFDKNYSANVPRRSHTMNGVTYYD